MNKITGKFNEHLADIFIKIFQIIFALLVVGMLLRENFNFYIFFVGLISSLACLTMGIVLYYNENEEGIK